MLVSSFTMFGDFNTVDSSFIGAIMKQLTLPEVIFWILLTLLILCLLLMGMCFIAVGWTPIISRLGIVSGILFFTTLKMRKS